MKRLRAPAALPDGVEIDLVRERKDDSIVHGLDESIDRVLGLLDERGRNPVLVGPSEVGKSAIARGVARRIQAGARPSGAKAVWQVSLRTLDARYGKDEGVGLRLGAILRAAGESPSRPIVFIRDLRTLRAFDAQHQLIEALRHSNARMLGEASSQFLVWCAEDPELAEVSHVVRVAEPSRERTMELLRLHAQTLTQQCGVQIEPSALERIVRYADRLMPQRKFPGKAIALLDESVREASTRSEHRVTRAVVTDRVCEVLSIPRFLIDPETPFDVVALSQHLRDRVVGQDDAIDALSQSLALYKADLSDEKRPLAVLMLAGSSGVGKTMLAERVAEYVFGSARRLVRVSLAEHSEDWKVDQLFGQRGAQTLEARRGVLARQLAGKPFSVLLLDEIEKAHPLAYKHFLRPFDEGTYLNGNDEEVSLRNTLVILTSRVGADVYREPSLGFTRGDAGARADSVRKRVADQFPGDLLDRIDRICVCPPLGVSDLKRVAERELQAALGRGGILERGITVEFDPEVLDRLITEIADANVGSAGARTMRRAVERIIIAPLAMYLLQHDLAHGSNVKVSIRDGAIVPISLPIEPSARSSRREIRLNAAARARESVRQSPSLETAVVAAAPNAEARPSAATVKRNNPR